MKSVPVFEFRILATRFAARRVFLRALRALDRVDWTRELDADNGLLVVRTASPVVMTAIRATGRALNCTVTAFECWRQQATPGLLSEYDKGIACRTHGYDECPACTGETLAA